MEYRDFIKSKALNYQPTGFDCEERNPALFGWQNDVVRWALRKGKCAIFSDCGTGKTRMLLQWAEMVHRHTGRPVLILAPLAVAQQTRAEGQKCGIDVQICRDQKDCRDGLNITNYEMLGHFRPEEFSGIVLDESSIIKHKDGKTRQMIQDMFEETPFKLCCTATPAPNDFMELGTHAQFLGVMKQTEMLATFFVHDGGETQNWRLKGHAEKKFFEWVAGWAACFRRPQDLGYEEEGYELPELRIHEETVESTDTELIDGQIMMFAPVGKTLLERRSARRNSLEDRVQRAAEIANGTEEQVLVWCDLNAESKALTAAIRGAVEVEGSMTLEDKEKGITGFLTGENRVLVSKPSIAGFGINAQNAHIEIFVGLSDSFEAYYQAVRRCWRFGQDQPVDVYIIVSDAEGAVKENIQRKQRDAERMTDELIGFTKEFLQSDMKQTTRDVDEYYAFEEMEVPGWLNSITA
ncbi:MAG: DEAD/DEAH box helicase [Clostridia bacterium]|nr:DEAD/DEAH box helicase [Clostridia bacterium]